MSKMKQALYDSVVSLVNRHIDSVTDAPKPAAINRQTAIDFVQWYESRSKSIDENHLTWGDLYVEFLKTKTI